MAKQREAIFERYDKVSAQLEASEQQLRSNVDPAREAIVHEKKILLFKQLCEDGGVEDDGLADILI